MNGSQFPAHCLRSLLIFTRALTDQVKFTDNELHAFFSGVGTRGSIHRELQEKYADLVASK